jgi:RNA processing factor Prp31
MYFGIRTGVFKMKMDIVESDLKQLFMWIKNLDELCKSQQVLIEVLDERVSNIEHDLAPNGRQMGLFRP